MASKNVISADEVNHVAKLANLPLVDKQINTFQPQLSSVLTYISKIQSIDTKNIKETHQVTYQTNVFREDKVDQSRILTQAEALQNALKSYQGYFVVKAVLG